MNDNITKQTLTMHGTMQAKLSKADGSVEVRKKGNLIVDVGFDLIINAIGATSFRPDIISHIATGTGTVAASAGDTALDTELNRQAATFAHTASTKVFTMTASFAAGVSTGAITEAGVLNAATTGILLDRVVFPVINKGSDDSLDITFTFTLS